LLRRLGVKNNSLPVDRIQKIFARNMLAIWGVEVYWEGLEHLEKRQSVVAMLSHGSNYDPFIGNSGGVAYKFIGKKSLFCIPFLGWLVYGWGHISIDRNHREAAIAALEKALRSVIRYNRSVALFPEGTRSKSGRLSEFKKGGFHMAIQARLPIQPIFISGAYQLWPPKRGFGESGSVVMRILPKIEVDKDDTYQTLLVKTRRAMLRAYPSPLLSNQIKRRPRAWLVDYFVPFSYTLLFLLFKFFL